MKRITPQHIRACKIPCPEELAQKWIDNPILTTKDLAHQYKVHPDFMRIRLRLGGLPYFVQAHRGFVIRRMNWGMTGNEKAVVPIDMKQCVCGILIPLKQFRCNYCAREFSILKKRKHEYDKHYIS